jgi:hypothetical protein
VARPDLPQFAGKAMTGRAVGYPVAALVVPGDLALGLTGSFAAALLTVTVLWPRPE